jgi:hypothetical protein
VNQQPDSCNKSLQDIYSSRVAGRTPINTIGLTGGNPLKGPVFEKDPITQQLENKLNQTISKIVGGNQQIKKAPNMAIVSKEQEAMDNIKKALEELKNLNAI